MSIIWPDIKKSQYNNEIAKAHHRHFLRKINNKANISVIWKGGGGLPHYS